MLPAAAVTRETAMGAEGEREPVTAGAENAPHTGATGIPDQVRSALRACFQAYPWVKRVLVFGSRARGDAEERSDIDLAVEAPGASEHQWLELYFAIEELDTLLKIDLVRLEHASDELRREILSHGVTVYERS